MKIYTEVILTEWCLPIEAAFWIAFGRPPERIDPIEVGETFVDYRRSWDTLVEGPPAIADYPLPNEIELTGIEVDTDLYFEGVFSKTFGPEERHIKKVMNDLEVGGHDISDFRASEKKTDEARRYADDLQEYVQPYIDDARAKLFLSLNEGKVRGQGFRYKMDDFREGCFEDIQKGGWTFEIFDGLAYDAEHPTKSYVCTYVSVPDLLACFPEPVGVPHRETGESSYCCLLQEGSQKKAPMRRPVGRPPKGGPLLKKAALQEALRMKNEGSWPDKKTAREASLIEYCERLGESVGRTTVQRWMLELPEI